MRLGRQASTARGLLAAAFALAALSAQVGPAAAGDDVCPEPNDAPANACPLGSVSNAHGYLDRPNDVDRYRIEVGQGQTVQATLGTLPGAYGLRLENGDGGTLTTASGGGTDERVLGAGGLAGGTYFLAVFSEGGDSSGDSPYVMRVSVVGAISGPPANVDPTAPPPPPARDRALEELVLTREEAGEEAKPSGKPTSGSVDGANWYEIVWKRDNSQQRRGPLVTINRVYRATDVAAAERLFEQQIRAGLPEARTTSTNYTNFGPQPMGPLGEDARAFGAGEDFNRDVVTRHYRIVFRIGDLVETLYTYGPDSGNNFNVAYELARRVEKRVHEGPAAPPPEIVTGLAPEVIGLRITDAGKEAVELFANSGSDGRSRWFEARFDRGIETYAQRLGPNHLYNKVIVANGNAEAREIFRENAVKELPEATEVRGAIFEESKTRRVGNETYAVGACNNDCGDQFTESLHERIVFRRGNVVVIVYTWGREDVSNPDILSTFAETINDRIR